MRRVVHLLYTVISSLLPTHYKELEDIIIILYVLLEVYSLCDLVE